MNHRPDGFTLIEVLVASALTAVVLGAIYGAFFSSYKAIEYLDGSIIRLHEARNALDIIGREAESALFNRDSDYTVFIVKDIDAYGAQTSGMSFTTYSPLAPGLTLVTYSVREDEENKTLTLMKSLSSPYDTDREPALVEAVERIESFTVEALHKDQWLKTWDGRAQGELPRMLRVTITVPSGNGSVTLSRTLTPKIGKAP